jgi:thiol-disulfide isomerase/thioredoxin
MVFASSVLTVAVSAAELREVKSVAEVQRRPAAGRLLVLNVWATWCGPCVHEMPDLRVLEEKFRARGVEFVGVSMDDVLPGDRDQTKSKVARFLSSRSIRYRNLYYTGKPDALAAELRFEGEIPVTLVYDRKGAEVMRVQGVIDPVLFSARLEAMLGEKRSRSR